MTTRELWKTQLIISASLKGALENRYVLRTFQFYLPG